MWSTGAVQLAVVTGAGLALGLRDTECGGRYMASGGAKEVGQQSLRLVNVVGTSVRTHVESLIHDKSNVNDSTVVHTFDFCKQKCPAAAMRV